LAVKEGGRGRQGTPNIILSRREASLTQMKPLGEWKAPLITPHGQGDYLTKEEADGRPHGNPGIVRDQAIESSG
jgi:hypothetical protein